MGLVLFGNGAHVRARVRGGAVTSCPLPPHSSIDVAIQAAAGRLIGAAAGRGKGIRIDFLRKGRIQMYTHKPRRAKVRARGRGGGARWENARSEPPSFAATRPRRSKLLFLSDAYAPSRPRLLCACSKKPPCESAGRKKPVALRKNGGGGRTDQFFHLISSRLRFASRTRAFRLSNRALRMPRLIRGKFILFIEPCTAIECQ